MKKITLMFKEGNVQEVTQFIGENQCGVLCSYSKMQGFLKDDLYIYMIIAVPEAVTDANIKYSLEKFIAPVKK